MSCHTTPDMEHTACGVFLGKNPWHSHGIPRARTVIKEMANDPDRTLIVIDPRVTESAELADIHLRVRPGGDAWLLGAILKILVSEDLADHDYLAARANRLDELETLLAGIDLAEWADKAGVPLDQIRHAARTMAEAESCAIFEDLGIQMAPHSTLNSWLEKLIFILTGNFGVKGGMNLHTAFGRLAGGGGGGDRRTPVGNHRILGGLMPCNGIPDEILTTHPDRLRAAFVESSNPVHSLADSPRWREAFEALEFSVVIDVAMTETAMCADYVLPASSQYEKAEATFFTLEFPRELLPSPPAPRRPARGHAARAGDPPAAVPRARRLRRRGSRPAPRGRRRGARRLRRAVLRRPRRQPEARRRAHGRPLRNPPGRSCRRAWSRRPPSGGCRRPS